MHVGISGTIYYGLLLHSTLGIYTVFLEYALWAVFCICRTDLINSSFSAVFHDNAIAIRATKIRKKNLREKKKGLKTCKNFIPSLSKEEVKYMILSTCLSSKNVKRSFTSYFCLPRSCSHNCSPEVLCME